MKAIIKLLIAALIANATWRVGSVYMTHYKFTDAVKSTTQFRGDMTDNQVRNRIFQLANQYDIPITDEMLTIRSEDKHTIVDASYRRPIEVVPGFKYEWPFTIHIDTFIVAPPKLDGSAVP